MYTFIFMITTIVYMSIGIYSLLKDSRAKTNRLFFVISILFSFWALVNGVLFLMDDASKIAVVRPLTVISWGLVYSFILHMVALISHRGYWYKSIYAYLLTYLPGIFNVFLYLIYPIRKEDLVLTELGWNYTMSGTYGLLWDYYYFFYYILTLVFTFLLIFLWKNTSDIKREMKQRVVLISTFLIAFLLGNFFEVIMPVSGYTYLSGVSVIITLIPFAGIWYSIRAYSFLSFNLTELSSQIVKLMKEGIIVVNLDGKIENANEGALRLLGYHRRKQLKNINIVTDSADVLFSSKERIETRFKTKQNQFIDVICSTSEIRDSLHELSGFICVFQDISKLKDAENELKDMNENLEILVHERTIELLNTNEMLSIEIAEKKEAHNTISNLAHYDHLTGLPNLRSFQSELNVFIKNSIKNDIEFAVVFLDLDSFKDINDTLGHDIGDELLISVANRLKSKVRSFDYVARVGGDEFILLLNDIKNEEILTRMLERIGHGFDDVFKLEEHQVSITTCMGVSLFPKHSTQAKELIKYADISLYTSKNSGRSSKTIYDTELSHIVTRKVELGNDMKRSLENGEFYLCYQPQVDSATKEVVSAEVLLRWSHPSKGSISPVEFIPIAEENGFIIELGNWVIDQVYSQVRTWKDANLVDIPISINLSVNQLMSSDLTEYIDKCSLKYDVGPDNIVFEITENLCLNFEGQLEKNLLTLKEEGYGISLDDFGVEYSSLRYLKEVPITSIKIDKIFIDGIGKNNKDESIIKSIIKLSNDLNLGLVSEGIETKEQLDFLTFNNCNIIQGYYFAKPLIQLDFEEFVSKSSEKQVS